MLQIHTMYPIARLGEAQGNLDIFFWSVGRYDDYAIYFTLVKDKDMFFKTFDTEGRTPIAYFHIQGNVKVPEAAEVVTRFRI